MRKMKSAGLSLLLLVPQIPVVAQTSSVISERQWREQCSTGSQDEMKKCLARAALISERHLKQTERNASGALQKWDEDPEYVDMAKSALIKSSKAFSAYKDVQCSFSASLAGAAAGNAREDRRLACVTDLNYQRIDQIKNGIDDLPTHSR